MEKEAEKNSEFRLDRLESIIEQIGKAAIATTETVERLAERMDDLATHVQHQAHQIQQQGYQIFALSDALQALIDSQTESRIQLNQLTNALQNLIVALETKKEI